MQTIKTSGIAHWFAICMSIFVCIAMLLSKPINPGGTEASRWSTVWSLTHDRGYVIDDSPYRTVDKVKREGHFYSSKPPILPTIVAGVVGLIREITGYDLPKDEVPMVWIVIFLINILPFYVVIIFYGRLLERQRYGVGASIICLFTMALGTYLTAYSASLNNHTVGACAAFMAVYNLIRIIYDGQMQWKYFFGAGVFGAWTVCNELPAGLLGLIMFFWLYRMHPIPTIKYFATSAAVVLSFYLYTTYLATGGMVPNYLRGDLYRYENSYWNNPQGIDGIDEPKSLYLFHFLVGHHGVFSLTPVFVFAFAGLLKDKFLATLHRITLLLTLVLFIFLIVKTNNYGGMCQGPRWTFWLIPMWLLGLAPVVEKALRNNITSFFLAMALIVSTISVVCGVLTERGPWGESWLHVLMRSQAWVDY